MNECLFATQLIILLGQSIIMIKSSTTKKGWMLQQLWRGDPKKPPGL